MKELCLLPRSSSQLSDFKTKWSSCIFHFILLFDHGYICTLLLMAFVLNEKALKVQSWVLGKCVGCLFFFFKSLLSKAEL